MADKLYFSRDARLYVELKSNAGAFQGIWEVPVLDGFSFSQSTNQTEIGLNEMESTAGISRRGRRLFTDSLAPAEWAFSTYIRPTKKGANHHLVDEVLWAAMAGADTHENAQSAGTAATTTESVDFFRNTSDKATSAPVMDVSAGTLTFAESNRSTLPNITLYFVFETDTTNPMVYKLSNAIVNECSIDFDIDGIATANWSGFAKEVTDLQTADAVFVGTSSPRASSTASNITTITAAADAVLTSSSHGLVVGQKVTISMENATGTDAADVEALFHNKTFTVATVPTSSTFTVGVDTSTKTFALSATATDTTLITATSVYLDSSSDLDLSVAYEVTPGTPGSEAFQVAYSQGVTSTANFIRNRLTQLEVRGQNPDVMEGKAFPITVSSNTFTTRNLAGTSDVAHGLKADDVVNITGLTGAGASAINGKNLFVKAIAGTAGAEDEFTLSTTKGGSVLSVGTVVTTDAVVRTGIYNFTLTGGNLTISNNVNYLVPEEIGTINKPIEGVTGARGIGGNFTCYLVFDDSARSGKNTGASADFFSDLVNADKGLTKVVNDFNITFKVGGVTSGQPRVNFTFPKAHIDVPTHSIEDVIALETTFGAYTEDFDTVDEFDMQVFGV